MCERRLDFCSQEKSLLFQGKELGIDEVHFLLQGHLGSYEELYPE